MYAIPPKEVSMTEHQRNSPGHLTESEYCRNCGEELLPDEAVCEACGTSVDYEYHELEEQRQPGAALKRTEVRIALGVGIVLIFALASISLAWLVNDPDDSIVGVGSHTEQLPTVDNPGEGLVVD